MQSGIRATAAVAEAGQYLTFVLGDEEYAINILRVQEIKGWEPVTEIPGTPGYFLGVTNLRGAIVPIIDLRRRLRMESVEYGKPTVVLVVKAREVDRERTVGFVVDAVSDVCEFSAEALRPPPDLGIGVRFEFVRGLATMADKMVILLDIDTLIHTDDIPAAGRITQGDESVPLECHD